MSALASVCHAALVTTISIDLKQWGLSIVLHPVTLLKFSVQDMETLYGAMQIVLKTCKKS